VERVSDTQGHEFDLTVQRFLETRWDTATGKRVMNEVIYGLKNSLEVRAILDPYVLKDKENSDPYAFPIYPVSRIGPGEFWVLTQDDLRGLQVYNESFPASPSFEVKALDYARFFGCVFDDANLERCSLTRARFENCSFQRTVLAGAGGFFTIFRHCNLTNACLWQAGFIDSSFTGSDLSGAYFEDAYLPGLTVDYRTRFGHELETAWRTRTIPNAQIPDILKAIRLAYNRAEMHAQADSFLCKERNAFRVGVLRPQLRVGRSVRDFWAWFVDFLWDITMGYGTKPFRILAIGPVLVIGFGTLYWMLGASLVGVAGAPPDVLESLYFSLTAFATLGFGDLHFDASHPWLRLMSAGEALLGGAWIATFIAVLSRKLIR